MPGSSAATEIQRTDGKHCGPTGAVEGDRVDFGGSGVAPGCDAGEAGLPRPARAALVIGTIPGIGLTTSKYPSKKLIRMLEPIASEGRILAN